MKFYLDDRQFGRMFITVRRNMKNISFIAKNGVLHISLPPGTTKEFIEKVIDEKRERLAEMLGRQSATAVAFHDGQVIPYHGGAITISRSMRDDGYVHAKFLSPGELRVTIPPNLSFDDPEVTGLISQLISKQMEYVVYKNVMPMLEAVAAELGVKYNNFEIGRGMRKLGHCTKNDVIQLSRNVALLPEHLIRYLICHELAHVTYKNHSPAFHALVNAYTAGREKALEAELRAFAWPIQR